MMKRVWKWLGTPAAAKWISGIFSAYIFVSTVGSTGSYWRAFSALLMLWGIWMLGRMTVQSSQPATPDHTELLHMLAQRARCFPNFPLGYHIPEVFSAIGQEPPEPEHQAAQAAPVQDGGCICHGNWRLLVKECEGLIGSDYISHDGKPFRLFGLVLGEDDLYYGMWHKEHGLCLLSCVGSIEGHGYKIVAAHKAQEPGA